MVGGRGKDRAIWRQVAKGVGEVFFCRDFSVHGGRGRRGCLGGGPGEGISVAFATGLGDPHIGGLLRFQKNLF